MRHLLFSLAWALLSLMGNSQNIGIGTINPDSSAKLEVSSTNSGFLPPRMTFQQRNAIANPARGLMVYCTDCGSWDGMPQYFDGKIWRNMNGEKAAGQVAYLPSVTIGNQIWTTKNLDVATYRNGDPIPQITDPAQWYNASTGAWCWYNNDSANYAAIYGRLYNWKAVKDPRGLAPLGWHIPTFEEFETFYNALSPTESGGSLKETGTAHWLPPNAGATNSTGFTARPGGKRESTFQFLGTYGVWWIIDYNEINGSTMYLSNSNNLIDYGNASGYEGCSVRLIRD